MSKHIKMKKGMAGSRNGRNRWEMTEVLKKVSKRTRRKQGREEARQSD